MNAKPSLTSVIRCLSTQPTYYQDGKYVRQPANKIILKNGQPQWQYPPPYPYYPEGSWDYPLITKSILHRLSKKGWIEEKNGVWSATPLGTRAWWYSTRRRTIIPKPVVSKYRRSKDKKNRPPYAYLQPSPPAPLPRRRPKVRHKGYRRIKQNWLAQWETEVIEAINDLPYWDDFPYDLY